MMNACGCSASVCCTSKRVRFYQKLLEFELERALSGRLVDDDAGGLTLEQALREIDETLSDGASDAGGLLADYRTYLVGRIARVADFRARRFPINPYCTRRL